MPDGLLACACTCAALCPERWAEECLVDGRQGVVAAVGHGPVPGEMDGVSCGRQGVVAAVCRTLPCARRDGRSVLWTAGGGGRSLSDMALSPERWTECLVDGRQGVVAAVCPTSRCPRRGVLHLLWTHSLSLPPSLPVSLLVSPYRLCLPACLPLCLCLCLSLLSPYRLCLPACLPAPLCL